MALPQINWWGVLGVTVGVLSLLAGMGASMAYILAQGKEAGRNEIRLEYSAAENTALQAAQKRIAELSAELQETERLIYEDSKDDAGSLPDSTRRQLDRMLLNQQRRDGDSD